MNDEIIYEVSIAENKKMLALQCDVCVHACVCGVTGAMSGWWTMWLWRAAYASECASTRTKLLVVGDWAKARAFGRDSSRI